MVDDNFVLSTTANYDYIRLYLDGIKIHKHGNNTNNKEEGFRLNRVSCTALRLARNKIPTLTKLQDKFFQSEFSIGLESNVNQGRFVSIRFR